MGAVETLPQMPAPPLPGKVRLSSAAAALPVFALPSDSVITSSVTLRLQAHRMRGLGPQYSRGPLVCLPPDCGRQDIVQPTHVPQSWPLSKLQATVH